MLLQPCSVSALLSTPCPIRASGRWRQQSSTHPVTEISDGDGDFPSGQCSRPSFLLFHVETNCFREGAPALRRLCLRLIRIMPRGKKSSHPPPGHSILDSCTCCCRLPSHPPRPSSSQLFRHSGPGLWASRFHSSSPCVTLPYQMLSMVPKQRPPSPSPSSHDAVGSSLNLI